MSNQRFSITPAKAAVDPDISDSVFRTLAVIGIYGDRNGWCWPSQGTIAELRYVTRQTVSAHIKILIDKEYLNIQPRYDEETGAQKSNMMQLRFDYDFTPPVKPKTLHPLSSLEFDTPCKPQDLTHNAPINDPKNAPVEGGVGLVFEHYENNIGVITPHIREVILDYLDDCSEDWLIAAMNIADERNARNWKYIKAILDRWLVEGKDNGHKPVLSTVEELEKAGYGRSK